MDTVTSEIQPHDGFITQWVFVFLPLQPSRILSTDSHPALAETTGLLISWVFSFLPRTIPTSTDQQGGGLLSDHPHGHNHYTHSPRTGVDSSRHTHGSESSPLVQGLVQDLNVYKTHGLWLSQWNLTTRDAFKMQWVFSFLTRQTNKYPRVHHTRV